MYLKIFVQQINEIYLNYNPHTYHILFRPISKIDDNIFLKHACTLNLFDWHIDLTKVCLIKQFLSYYIANWLF